MGRKRKGQREPVEEVRAEVLAWSKEVVEGFLASSEALRCQFENLANDYLSGRDITAQLARLMRLPPFFSVANLIRQSTAAFEATLDEMQLDEDEAGQLRSMHSAFFPILEDALDAAVDADLYGVTNTWAAVRVRPFYVPAQRLLMLDVRLLRGLDTVYSSSDKLEDFLGLAASLAHYCASALADAAERRLEVDPDQVRFVGPRVARLEAAAVALRAAVSQLGGEVPSGESASEEARQHEVD